ncbi:MAG: hypothetical protein L7S49_05030, partial [Candidatus Poseidoniaceae archaeon]|nr:hypothetical protein [Candidatus Poseidoniaceae archaeon]
MLVIYKQTSENLGKVLILTGIMFWFYRNNLNSMNYLIVLVIIISALSAILMKTKLFTKKEEQKFRRTKVISLIIAIMIMLIATTATIVINFVDEIGADSH